MKKSMLKINTTDLEDAMFTHVHPSGNTKYKDTIGMFINYVQHKYSAVVYLRKAISYGNMTELALQNKTNKHNKNNKHTNQSDAEFDMKVLKWNKDANTIFGRKRRTEEGKQAMYSLFTDQFKPSQKNKLKENKG